MSQYQACYTWRTMQHYELTIVLDGRATAVKKKAVTERIETMVKTFNGKMGEVKDWGEKELSYKINKSTAGIYLHFPMELNPLDAKTIPSKLKRDEDIIRYLIVKS